MGQGGGGGGGGSGKASCPVAADDGVEYTSDGVQYGAAGALALPLAADAAPFVVAGALIGAVAYNEYRIWVDVINLTTASGATRGHIDGDGGFVLDDVGWDGIEPRGTFGQSNAGHYADNRAFWQRLIDSGLLGNRQVEDQSQGQGERTDDVTGSQTSEASALDVDVNGNIVDPDIVDTQTGRRWDGGAINGPADRGVTTEKIQELVRDLQDASARGLREAWKPKPRGSAMLVAEWQEDRKRAARERARQAAMDASAKFRDLSRSKNMIGVSPDGTVHDPHVDQGDPDLDDVGPVEQDNPDQDGDGQGDDTQDAQEQFGGLKPGEQYWWENENLMFELWNAGQGGNTGPSANGGQGGDAGLGDSFGGTLNAYGGYGGSQAGGAPLVGGGAGLDNGTGYTEGASGGGSEDNTGVGDSPDGTGGDPVDGFSDLPAAHVDAARGAHIDFEDYVTTGGVHFGQGDGDHIPTTECFDGCVCHCSYLPNYGSCPSHGNDEWPGVTREYSGGSYRDVCNGCGCVSSYGRVMGGSRFA